MVAIGVLFGFCRGQFLQTGELIAQAVKRHPLVAVLRALIPRDGAGPGRDVRRPDCAVGRVLVLAAGTARPERLKPNICWVQSNFRRDIGQRKHPNKPVLPFVFGAYWAFACPLDRTEPTGSEG